MFRAHRRVLVFLVATATAAPSIAAHAAASSAQTPDGKALFETHCQKCHGPRGHPSAGMKKLLPELPTWDAAFFRKRTEEDVLRVLQSGKGKNMKSFADRLTPEERSAVAKYIRTLNP